MTEKKQVYQSTGSCHKIIVQCEEKGAWIRPVDMQEPYFMIPGEHISTFEIEIAPLRGIPITVKLSRIPAEELRLPKADPVASQRKDTFEVVNLGPHTVRLYSLDVPLVLVPGQVYSVARRNGQRFEIDVQPVPPSTQIKEDHSKMRIGLVGCDAAGNLAMAVVEVKESDWIPARTDITLGRIVDLGWNQISYPNGAVRWRLLPPLNSTESVQHSKREAERERKYSVSEIDRLRAAVVARNEAPHPNPYTDQELTEWSKRVEQRVKTYMNAGTEPEELEALVNAMPIRDRGPFPWKNIQGKRHLSPEAAAQEAAAHKFKIGDKVRLKEGSHLISRFKNVFHENLAGVVMTVNAIAIDGKSVDCKWFSDDGAHRAHVMPTDQLENAP